MSGGASARHNRRSDPTALNAVYTGVMHTSAQGERPELGTRVSATDLHRRTAEVLRMIRQGRSVTITFGHFGEAQAMVVPVKSSHET